MLDKALASNPTLQIKKIMAFAMSEEKVEEEYLQYLKNPFRMMYLYEDQAIIGIELKRDFRCEIRHIAVSNSSRKRGIATRMIEEVIRLQNPKEIFAETDQEAVGFYRKTGFQIKSLGEKYPGRERFYCVKTLPVK